MKIPSFTAAEKRLVLTLGDHQDEDDPLIMKELAEKIEEPIKKIQRGKQGMASRGYVDVQRDHPATYLYLTDRGREFYRILKELQELCYEED